MPVASLMLAHQVAGKAARDAFFLSQFGASYFPLIVMAGSAVSIAAGLLNSRVLQMLTPARMVPWTFLASGCLHFLEWLLLAGPYRSAVVVLIYVHIVAFGAIVLSGFWSLLNERFDPLSGKQHFGRIAGFGTLGGILGGIAAERFAVLLPANSILLFLGSLHLLSGCLAFIVVSRSRSFARPESKPNGGDEDQVTWAALPLFRRSEYVKKLALLVLLGTSAAALLDIVFKTQAATLIGRGPGLLRFFAIFYTVGQLLSFAVQVLVTQKWLQKQGLVRGIGSLPTLVAAGGVGAIVFPSFPVLVVTRALEIVLRGSIYRAGYELLYTPLPVQEKRAAKPVADVVFDRMGDVLGGAASQLFLAIGGAFAVKGILLVSVAVSGIALFVIRQLERLYIQALEKGLLERAIELDVSTSRELLTHSVLLKTLPPSGEHVPATPDQHPATPEPVVHTQLPKVSDPVLQRLMGLRSGDPELVRRSLKGVGDLDAICVPQVIVLLGWDEVAPDAVVVLRTGVDHIAGQLLDALLDEKTDFAIRRRIPRVLAYANDRRAAEGLMRGLNDSRFEVRFQCARAFDLILQRNPEYSPDPNAVFGVIERELSVGPAIWGSRRLLDPRQSAEQFLFLDSVLKERANLSWEHLFSLLALILPREPLKVAFQALHTNDLLLRGLAVEYLDSVLPASLKGLHGFLEMAGKDSPRPEAPEDVAQRLMEVRQTITLKLKE